MNDIEGVLLSIHKRLNRIESRNPNYTESPTWQKLRKLQDEAFVELAKEKKAYYELEWQARQQDRDESKIKFFDDFIKKNENKNNFALQQILESADIDEAFKEGLKSDIER